MNSVIITVIVLVSTVLLIESVRIFTGMFGTEHYRNVCFTSVSVMTGDEDTEKKICSIINKVRWTDEDLIGKIILVDGGLTDVQKEICIRFCDRYDFLEFSSPDHLNGILFKIQKNSVK